MRLPDLKRLSHEEKDELILKLWHLVEGQASEIRKLEERIKDLEGRLSLNSKNSSKPPSSDGYQKPQPKSLREVGKRPSGGQKGHPGYTLKRAENPDEIIRHLPPEICDVCEGSLAGEEISEGRSRQVYDLAPLRFEVTEHRVMQKQCRCGKVHSGKFPEQVKWPVQYGPRVLATMVHLSHHHMLPVQRSAALINDMFGLPVSEGTVIGACKEAAERLTPCVEAIGQALQRAPVAHADETGLRVKKATHWIHVVATKSLTWMARHVRRGKIAIKELGLLPNFKGTLIHDGWESYWILACKHGLCNAHHLRELTYQYEEFKQPWAGAMIRLLKWAHKKTEYGKLLEHCQIQKVERIYQAILKKGEAANPRKLPDGTRGRTKQSKAANLLARLREYITEILLFMTDPSVPFSNNIAEQSIRMPKVKQKISGCFRTEKGSDIFCTIRSYLATLAKQGAHLLLALTHTFLGSPPLPILD